MEQIGRPRPVSFFQKEHHVEAQREFVVLDIETTGFSKYTDSIVEIAALKFIDCVEVDRFVTLVNPGRLIPKAVVAVHHITDSMVKDAPAISEVMPAFLQFVGDSLIVGHNTNFDVGFLDEAARKLGYAPDWRYVDTIPVAKRILPGLRNYKQATVLEAIGYKQQQFHRAEQDCRGCAQILLLAMDRIS